MASLRSCRVGYLAVVFLFVFPALFPCNIQARPAEGAALSGIVRDNLGSVLQGVEVLVVDKTFAPTPVASTRSDRQGRFRVEDLPLGAYRIAALKDGYLTFIGQVDTRLQQWVHVVLNPMPEPGEQDGPAPPESSSWSYRVPRRYVLHDEGAEVEPAGAVSPPVETASSREALRMRVDQLFSLAADVGRDRPPSGDAHGTETRLELATPVGDRGSIDVNGYRESFDSSLETVEAASEAASRESAALNLAFAYETGSDARLAVSAFYNERQLAYSPAADPTTPLTRGAGRLEQGQRHWGYDASWTARLEGAGRVELGLDYRDTTLRAPGAVGPVDLATGTDPVGTSLAARSIGARGNYEVVPFTDHTVNIDFRAGLLETARSGPAVSPAALWTPAFHELAGRNIAVAARDTWNFGGPFSVIYGLGYRHAITEYETSLLVPSVGAEWRAGGLTLRAIGSYHDVTRSGPETVMRPDPERLLGYEAEVVVPLARDVNLSGGARFSPVEFDYIGRAGGHAGHDAPPLYLSDGQASVDETWVSLARGTRRMRTYLELARGRVEGTLAAMTTFDVPDDFLAASAIDFGSGLVGVNIVDSGTDVVLVFQRLVRSPEETAGIADSEQRAVEIRVTQEVLDMRSVGLWRVLVGFRRATLESDGDDPSDGGDRGALASLDSQLSAGLSVSF